MARPQSQRIRLTQQQQQQQQQPDLPTEILTKILGHLSGKRDCKNVALCSHLFYSIIAPTLYKAIYVNAGTDTRHQDPSRAVVQDELRSATLYLLHRGRFAPSIRHVRLCGPTGDDYARQDSLGSQQDRVLSSAVQKYLRRPENASTRLALMGVNWLTFNLDDRITVPVLFLTLLPNLTSLHLQIHGEQLLADGLLSLNAVAGLGLEEATLEWVPWVGRALISSFDVKHCKDVIGLPSLRKVCFARMVAPGSYPRSTHPFRVLKPGSSSVRQLGLEESKLGIRDFEYVVAAFQSLDTFVHEQSWHPHLDRRSVRVHDMLLTLRNYHKDTLENVWINVRFRQRVPPSRIFDTMRPGLTCLFDIHSLKRLCLPMEMLYTHPSFETVDNVQRYLPPKLETLVLIRYDLQSPYTFSAFAEDFLRRWNTFQAERDAHFMPRLQTLAIIADVDQYLGSSQHTVEIVSCTLDLEVVLAMDEHCGDGNELEDRGNERMAQIAQEMGLNKFGERRFVVIDKNVWRRLCRRQDLPERDDMRSASIPNG